MFKTTVSNLLISYVQMVLPHINIHFSLYLHVPCVLRHIHCHIRPCVVRQQRTFIHVSSLILQLVCLVVHLHHHCAIHFIPSCFISIDVVNGHNSILAHCHLAIISFVLVSVIKIGSFVA